MLVCLFFFFVVSDNCGDDGGVQRKFQGRGMSACVIIFSGVSTRGS